MTSLQYQYLWYLFNGVRCSGFFCYGKKLRARNLKWTQFGDTAQIYDGQKTRPDNITFYMYASEWRVCVYSLANEMITKTAYIYIAHAASIK